MRTIRTLAAAVLLLGGLFVAPAPARAADVEFLAASAQAEIAGTFRFETRFRSGEEPIRVELLTRFAGAPTSDVVEADVEDGPPYVASVSGETSVLPNSTLSYRFRVTTETGTALGPAEELQVVDQRLEWQTLEGRFVHLHWHEGNQAFAERALKIGDDAVARIADLLGVEETEPIDFFVYADQTQFQQALGPGTREYVAGRAVPEIRTLFALIDPSEIGSGWVESVVPHELAHLVFDTAVSNPYHGPPHWLNEGLAVYLSDGYDDGWQAILRQGVAQDRVVPLSGLAAKFPPGEDRFRLGYAEGASAVDLFVRTYGEDTLVELVRSYAEGLTDDDAFKAATGSDFAAFDVLWQREVADGALREFGPQPGAAGPRPEAWGAPAATTPPRTFAPGGETPVRPGVDGFVDDGLGLPQFALTAAVALVILVIARRRRRPAAATPPAAAPPVDPPGAWPPAP
jgi:hypothetical protein